MNKLYKWYAKIFARPFFYKWNFRLFRFALSGLGILNYYDQNVSGEKHFVNKVLPKYLGRSPIVVDVGANLGNYSKLLLNKFPDAELHLFEPHPETFKKLDANEFNAKTYFNNLALSNSNGKIEIFDYKNRDGSSHASVYKGVITNIHQSETVTHEVDKITLDKYINERDIESIDLLKVDVEGHELKVFNGADKAINEFKIRIVYFEFNEMNIESDTFLKDILDILQNYNIYRMLPNSLLPLRVYRAITHEIFAYQNILAIRKDIDQEN